MKKKAARTALIVAVSALILAYILWVDVEAWVRAVMLGAVAFLCADISRGIWND